MLSKYRKSSRTNKLQVAAVLIGILVAYGIVGQMDYDDAVTAQCVAQGRAMASR